jgi:hypothetical protein
VFYCELCYTVIVYRVKNHALCLVGHPWSPESIPPSCGWHEFTFLCWRAIKHWPNKSCEVDATGRNDVFVNSMVTSFLSRRQTCLLYRKLCHGFVSTRNVLYLVLCHSVWVWKTARWHWHQEFNSVWCVYFIPFHHSCSALCWWPTVVIYRCYRRLRKKNFQFCSRVSFQSVVESLSSKSGLVVWVQCINFHWLINCFSTKYCTGELITLVVFVRSTNGIIIVIM